MSVLIKGMKMPESCCVCPVNMESCNYGFEYLRDHPELYEQRAENCPIIEVSTPHGRLIDGDELLKRKGDAYDSRGHSLYVVGTGYIVTAPTIIEKEIKNEQ